QQPLRDLSLLSPEVQVGEMGYPSHGSPATPRFRGVKSLIESPDPSADTPSARLAARDTPVAFRGGGLLHPPRHESVSAASRSGSSSRRRSRSHAIAPVVPAWLSPST